MWIPKIWRGSLKRTCAHKKILERENQVSMFGERIKYGRKENVIVIPTRFGGMW